MQISLQMKRKVKSAPKPVRSSDAPATTAMLYEMEERLNHQMASGFSSMKSEFHNLRAEVHRVALLVEEQNARNRFVMDGYAQLYDLIDKRLGASN